MMELPEAMSLAKQINNHVVGKKIKKVISKQSEHKFTWYYGSPERYQEQLMDLTIDSAKGFGSFLEVSAEKMRILYNEGINLRLIKDKQQLPKKHQLVLAFTDNTFLSASVHMYGGVGCIDENTPVNEYYSIAKTKPSPVTSTFDEKYFTSLISHEDVQKLSAKAFLATEQRIPGLGNGVLQDILYNARIHPKQKIDSLSEVQRVQLFESVKNTLHEMVEKNGRDTEKDLFSEKGGYLTKMSKHTVGSACTLCGYEITKASYLGGSVYFCPGCQRF